jgi:hypothetical protein
LLHAGTRLTIPSDIILHTHPQAPSHAAPDEARNPLKKCFSEFLYSSVSFPFSSISVVGAVLFPIPAVHQNDKVAAEVHSDAVSII